MQRLVDCRGASSTTRSVAAAVGAPGIRQWAGRRRRSGRFSASAVRGAVLGAVLAAALILPGCGTVRRDPAAQAPSMLRIQGSDTMRILVLRWAEEFMRRNRGVSIYVEGGGSGSGIEALIRGEADLCMASRALEADEVRRLMENQGSLGIQILCAKDALSIYLHPDTEVRNLDLPELRDLFLGRIRNWSVLGGPDREVVVFIREPNSGTRAFIQAHILEGEPFSPEARVVVGTRALADSVASRPGGIGFGGLAYGPNVLHCPIEGFAPSDENVRSGSYPIARYLYFYTRNQPQGLIKEFTDFVLGPEGQALVSEVGYVPLWIQGAGAPAEGAAPED